MRVVFSYDTEIPGECVPKLAAIASIHRRLDAPATIFVTGEVVERDSQKLMQIINEAPDLWDVNSHGYRHRRIIHKPPWSLPDPTPELIHEEITKGIKTVREVLDRPCRGFRPRTGAGAGFRGCPDALTAMAEVGASWSSAYIRSTFADAIPADFYGPFTYKPDGYSEITELPAHGWADCFLKAPQDLSKNSEYIPITPENLVVRWPMGFAEAYPSKYIETPEEEFNIYRATLDYAEQTNIPYLCLVAHPFSMIWSRDPEGKAIEMFITYAKEKGCEISTLDAEERRCQKNPQTLWTAPDIPPQRTKKVDVARYFA